MQHTPESSVAGDVAAAYNRWSSQYDSDDNRTRDLDAQVVRTAALNLRGHAVLELGCGTGKNTAWFAAKARHVIAMDFSPGMLSVAETQRYPAPVQFLRHDIREPWPLPDHSLDVVVGNLVLEHVQDLTPVYSEAARVLRVGGQLFLCELHPYRQHRGGQAHFAEHATGETVHIPASVHSASEYVNTGLACGFKLEQLGEWHDDPASADAPPRLLSVLFERVR
jgi:ubiquinone/menaquinone biosynthesis C-methylase UbiE